MPEIVRYSTEDGESAYRIVTPLPHPDPASAAAGATVLKWFDCEKGEYAEATEFPRDALVGDGLRGPFPVEPGQPRDIVTALLSFIASVECAGGINRDEHGSRLAADEEWDDLLDDYEAACAAVRKKRLINGRYK